MSLNMSWICLKGLIMSDLTLANYRIKELEILLIRAKSKAIALQFLSDYPASDESQSQIRGLVWNLAQEIKAWARDYED